MNSHVFVPLPACYLAIYYSPAILQLQILLYLHWKTPDIHTFGNTF